MGNRRAKIIGTLGPSSSTVEQICGLIKAGLNVARVNMSHGTHEGHAQLISNIREASKLCNQEVGILLDLQGPKIRVDKLKENLILEEGQTWFIGTSNAIDNHPDKADRFIPTVYKDLVADAREGARILFDDGNLAAVAKAKTTDLLEIEVTVGGELKSNKGINLPDCDVSAPSLTEKDEKDLMFGLSQNIDFIALSFVRRAEDVLKVKYILHKYKLRTPIISKIEKPEAVENIDEIIEATDFIMIARGDMGVEVGNHLVPAIQKQIIDKCNATGVPVITATQMLESMITNPLPTRAEASDVANAIWDGTDAVMLSGESAAGKYPVQAVEMMSSIIEEAEKQPKERPLLRNVALNSVTSTNMVAASLIAEKTNAKWIISMTEGGSSCRKMSRFRPNSNVLGLTNDLKVVRRMTLYWGITPFLLPEHSNRLEILSYERLKNLQIDLGLEVGDRLVITHGDGRYYRHGYSNSIRVETIRASQEKVSKGSENIESAEFDKGVIHLDQNVCASCQNCVSVCPHDIYQVFENGTETKLNKANVDRCTLDFQCVEKCPTGAIEIIPNSGHDEV